MAANERDWDPYLSLNFWVECDRILVAAFSEVSGLQVEVETEDYREGGVNEYIHRLAGPAWYPTNVTLKHGIMDTDELWRWQQEVVQGVIERKTVAILLTDSAGQPTWIWNLVEAYPVKWSGPDLRAGTAEVAIETLELVHHGITTQAP